MIVSRLSLKKWHNFQSVDVRLNERVFLAGPNASGKSNLLDVFRFVRDIAKPGGGLQKAVSDRGGISKIRCLAARRHPDIELEMHLGDNGSEQPLWKYAIGIKQEVRGYRQPYLSYERVWLENKQILSRPDESDKTDLLRLMQTHLEQINANAEFREISKFFLKQCFIFI
jgi:predicted ATPase